MAIRKPRYPKEEFARRGKDIFEHDVQPKLTAEDYGKYVAIDIETRQWEMDADELAADERLLARVPDAQMWMDRVGYRYTVRFGGASLRRQG
jgi:hypothetical protein